MLMRSDASALASSSPTFALQAAYAGAAVPYHREYEANEKDEAGSTWASLTPDHLLDSGHDPTCELNDASPRVLGFDQVLRKQVRSVRERSHGR